jgi:hypothetical protein
MLFAVLVSKDPSSLTELESQASENPEVKGKGKGPLDNLSSILFSLLESTSSSDFDPLVLVAPGGTYTDAELRRAGLGKKEKATVRNIQLALVCRNSSSESTGCRWCQYFPLSGRSPGSSRLMRRFVWCILFPGAALNSRFH